MNFFTRNYQKFKKLRKKFISFLATPGNDDVSDDPPPVAVKVRCEYRNPLLMKPCRLCLTFGFVSGGICLPPLI